MELQELMDQMNRRDEYEKYLSGWLDALDQEVAFWYTVLREDKYKDQIRTTGYSQYHYEDEFRYDPFMEKGAKRFLEVGPGPSPDCGNMVDVTGLEIHAIDALAHFYEKMKKEEHIETKVATEFGCVEYLADRFSENYFDVAHAHNSMDHCFNPLFGILQMLYVTKVGGTVVLMHWNNVAVEEKYQGLHRWNFVVEDGAFILWNKEIRINITELLAPYADLICDSDERKHKITITKKAELPRIVDNNKLMFQEAFWNKMLDYMHADVIRKLSFTERVKRKLTGKNW